MRRCIYCREKKADGEFTLEHVIPQFMGGAYAPDCFKIRDVCKRCNSNLGLFVDAGFEKNWLISNKLRQDAYAFYDPNNPVGLPLICMGKTDLVPPQQQEDEIYESWLGPLGEQIYWIRPHDERLYWYTGGNPITTKTTDSRAYFMFSERSPKNPLISWLAFRDAFAGRRVKKIMCTTVEGANPADIGFEASDELDQLRVDFFNEACHAAQTRKNRLAIYTLFDFRFLAKLGLGIAYSLFGVKALQTVYAEELYKALWYRDGDSQSQINATSAITHGNDPRFSKLTGEENAVTVTILPSHEGIAVSLNLGVSLNWIIMCASLEGLTTEDIGTLQYGRVIVLYRQLQRGINLGLPQYIAHKCGNHPHPELTEISAQLSLYRDYFKNL
ncbi:MAG: HNH endonuclease [Smithella sp.]